MQEYIKHILIRTPLERPAQKLAELLKFRRRWQHPEMKGDLFRAFKNGASDAASDWQLI